MGPLLRLFSVVVLLGLWFSLAGCSNVAPNVAAIDVPYVPQPNVAAVPGAQNLPFTIEAREGRMQARDRIATASVVGAEAPVIVTRNDIPQTAAGAVRHELESLGFRYGPGGTKVIVEVTRFTADFTGTAAPENAPENAIASVALDVEIVAPDGIVIYANHNEGGAIETNVHLAAAAPSARTALMGAFTNAVAGIVFDTALRQALTTGRVPQKAEPMLSAEGAAPQAAHPHAG
jgi:hypothetical protein